MTYCFKIRDIVIETTIVLALPRLGTPISLQYCILHSAYIVIDNSYFRKKIIASPEIETIIYGAKRTRGD